MSTSSSVEKKWRQTDISSYFTGAVKRVLPLTPLQRRIRYKNRRSMSVSATSSLDVKCFMLETRRQSDFHFDLNSFNISKRKLPVPILSDDENEDCENEQPTNPKVKQPPVPISLNRPTSLITSETPSTPFAPLKCSTPSPKKLPRKSLFLDDDDEIPCCSKTLPPNKTTHNEKTIRVLENVVVKPQLKMPMSSPEKRVQTSPTTKEITPKTEDKKINFENLKVMREFFLNVLKIDHLKLLLSDEDKDMLCKFFNLDKYYQYTCVKLFFWQRMWYNIFKYVEKIGLTLEDHVVVDMYTVLQKNGFVETDFMVEDSFTLLNLLSLKDVRDIQRSFKLPYPETTKVNIISKLLKNCKTQITLTCLKKTEDVLRERIKEKMGFCVKLSDDLYRCLYTIFLLNTFTNSTLIEPQDYFANVSYFYTVFPNYKVENFHIFYTQNEFFRYMNAIQLHRDLEKSLEKKDVVRTFEICKSAYLKLEELNGQLGDSFDSSREKHLERFTPNAVYIRILTKGAKFITTSHSDQVKIWFEHLLSQKFCAYLRAEWYCHLTLIYTTYLKDYEKTARLLIAAFEQDSEHFSEVQLHELAHRGKVLNKKTYDLELLFHDQIAALSPPTCDRDWPQTVIDSKSITNEEPGRKRTYVQRCENGDVNYLTVEEIALEHYRSCGYPNGMHSEGSLITVLYCLLFWDVIYDKYVKGTFVSKVQNVPLDFFTKHFYTNRQLAIKRRLKDIAENWKDEELQMTLVYNFDQHSHENSVCQIDSIVPESGILFDLVMCIGRRVLAKIFERLATNFKVFRSGFPDLIVWNYQQRKAKFVEVKGENDKLSIKQKLWLNYLMDNGADVEVCHVQPKSKKKLKKR